MQYSWLQYAWARDLVLRMGALVAVTLILSQNAFAQATRIVTWPPSPKASAYLINIYVKGREIVAYNITSNQFEVPKDAVVEVVGLDFIHNKTWPVAVLRPSDLDNEPKTSAEKPVDDGPTNLGVEEDVFDYQTKALSDSYLDETSSEFFEEMPKPSRSANTDPAKAIGFNGDIGLGVQANQESILSQGIVGVFDGAGLSYGLELQASFYPRKREYSELMFTSAIDVSEFITDSETVISDQDPVVNQNKNTIYRLRGGALFLANERLGQRLFLGIGFSYERLPFFEMIDENVGTGRLNTKDSVGFSMLSRWERRFGDSNLMVDIGVTPIGASLTSILQADFAFTLQSEPEAGDLFGYFLTLKSKYQKIRYLEECSNNNTATCVFPKTEGYAIGPLIGIFANY